MLWCMVRTSPKALALGSQLRSARDAQNIGVRALAKRIGIEKRGDAIAIFISLEGEPLHQFGPQVNLHFDEPFYVGIGFCSHLPDKSDTALLSGVLLENSAGQVR